MEWTAKTKRLSTAQKSTDLGSWSPFAPWINAADRGDQLSRSKWGVAESYRIIGSVEKCVELIASGITSLPYSIKRFERGITGTDDKWTGTEIARSDDPIPQHPLFHLFHAYEDHQHMSLLFRVAASLTLFDELYIELVRKFDNAPVSQYNPLLALDWLNPLGMSINAFNGKINQYFYSPFDTAKPATYEPFEIAYKHGYNPEDDLRGYPDVLAVLESLEIDFAIQTAVVAHFRNGIGASAVVSPKAGFSNYAATREALDDAKKRSRGPENYGGFIYWPGDVDVTRIDYPDYGAITSYAKDTVERILDQFGVPRAILGNSDIAGYKQGDEVTYRFYVGNIIPRADDIVRFFNRRIIPLLPAEYHLDRLVVDRSEFDRVSENDQRLADIAGQNLQNTISTINESRKRQNLPEFPPERGNLLIVQQGTVFISPDDLVSGFVAGGTPEEAAVVAQTSDVEDDGDLPPLPPEDDEPPPTEPEPPEESPALPSGQKSNLVCVKAVMARSQPAIDNWDWSVEKAHKELDAWYTFVKRRGANGLKHLAKFEPNYTRGDIADTVLESFKGYSKSESGLTVKAIFGMVKDWVAIKAIQATRIDFEDDFEDTLQVHIDGKATRRQSSARLRSIIRKANNKVFRDGLTDGGALGEEPTDAEQVEINQFISEQSQFVSSLLGDVKSGKLARAQGKGAQWYNKSVKPMYDAGLVSAGGNKMVEWVLGKTEVHCFPAGTLVATDNGWCAIEDVAESEKVYTPDGFREVTATMANQYEGDLIQVTQGDNRVICTPNHPFLTQRGWIRADELRQSDYAIVAQDSDDNAFAHIVFPNPLNMITTSTQIFVLRLIAFLLGFLPFGQRFKAWVSMPILPVSLNDKFTYTAITNEFGLDNWEWNIGDGQFTNGIQNCKELQFQFSGIPLLPATLTFSKFNLALFPFRRVLIPIFENLSNAFRIVHGVISSHVFRRHIMNESSVNIRGNINSQSASANTDCFPRQPHPLRSFFAAKSRIQITKHIFHIFCPFFVRVGIALLAVVTVTLPFAYLAATGAIPISIMSFWGIILWALGAGLGLFFAGVMRIAATDTTEPLIGRDWLLTLFANLRHNNDLSTKRIPTNSIPVYNLEVQGNHQYVANGFLVHNCRSCKGYNGQRHRFKTFLLIGAMPQSDTLVCNGYNCDCNLVNVRAKARGTLRLIIKSIQDLMKAGTFDESKVERDESGQFAEQAGGGEEGKPKDEMPTEDVSADGDEGESTSEATGTSSAGTQFIPKEEVRSQTEPSEDAFNREEEITWKDNLTRDEDIMIRAWSSNTFDAIQEKDKNPNALTRITDERYNAFVSGVDKSPSYDGVAWRGGIRPLETQESTLEDYKNKIGSNITFDTHSSASGSAAVAGSFAGERDIPVTYEIHSKRGKYINSATISVDTSDNEFEVVFQPNSEFTIRDAFVGIQSRDDGKGDIESIIVVMEDA